MSEPVRFIHASDFHLERPAGGIAEVPTHLREMLLEAPFLAAERVFESALSERADFVVLSGDIVHPGRGGPRALLFLLEQFQRLAERKIPVYWAGGSVDPPESWPAELALPPNVHYFKSGALEEVTFSRGGKPLMRIMGESRKGKRKFRGAEAQIGRSDLPTIVVTYAPGFEKQFDGHLVEYWALGGQHDTTTVQTTAPVVHYPGSPQGRTPEEHGPHGCTLVSREANGTWHSRAITCDVLRWHPERIVIDEATSDADLERMLSERMQSLVQGARGTDLLVTWSVSGTGSVAGRLRQGKLSEQILEKLRRQYGKATPPAWSVAIEAAPPATAAAPHLYQEESLLGDFLREVRRYQSEPNLKLRLADFVGSEVSEELTGLLADVEAEPARQNILRHIAALGTDLLGAEEITR